MQHYTLRTTKHSLILKQPERHLMAMEDTTLQTKSYPQLVCSFDLILAKIPAGSFVAADKLVQTYTETHRIQTVQPPGQLRCHCHRPGIAHMRDPPEYQLLLKALTLN